MRKTFIYAIVGAVGLAGMAETAPLSAAESKAGSPTSLEQLRAKVRSEAMTSLASGDVQTVGRRGWRGGGRGWRGGGRHWGGRGWGGRRHWGGRRYYGGRRYWGGRGYYGRPYYGGRRWCGYDRWGYPRRCWGGYGYRPGFYIGIGF